MSNIKKVLKTIERCDALLSNSAYKCQDALNSRLWATAEQYFRKSKRYGYAIYKLDFKINWLQAMKEMREE